MRIIWAGQLLQIFLPHTSPILQTQNLPFNGFYVMILDTMQFNAFASPGGHIFLTRGLVEATTSEDMLAALIAHEMAHIQLKHGLNLISSMDITNQASAM